jgi:hypothetical protein
MPLHRAQRVHPVSTEVAGVAALVGTDDRVRAGHLSLPDEFSLSAAAPTKLSSPSA